MAAYMKETDNTVLSLSNLQIHHNTTGSSELVNHTLYQDFFGFSSEEWSPNTSYDNSPENIIFCGKLISSKRPISKDNMSKPTTMVEVTNSPLFRSTSGSFRYMPFKIASRPNTSRSKMSLTFMERSRLMASSKSKSRWQVFLFGFRSGKFPKKMDLSDIKIRQLRHQSTTTKVSSPSADLHVGWEESVGRRTDKKGWWRVVDVLGCGGGYL
ncbi:hypothetical protein L6452_11879 [Arctium lappa]|uniref:Uncharacterized protein n=1 Tax=Arctium lappa TaxID=4217 RepID=A0ACB9DQ92_ARCLA|nr:hypothetical protein L6452_11879 [Arctium lappa]